jgi:hypothetical protein
VLQGVLTGDSKTSVICNVNQDVMNCNETLSTLRFGIEAGSIKLNIEKAPSSEEEKPESRTPSTRKSRLRENLAQKVEDIRGLELENFRLKSLLKIEANKLTLQEKISKEKDELVKEYKRKNDVLEKNVKDFGNVISNIKEREQKKIEEEQKNVNKNEFDSYKKLKKNFDKSDRKNVGSENMNIDLRDREKSPLKNSEQYMKKRFERKSRNVSPRVSHSPKSKHNFINKYNDLMEQNKELKRKLLIYRLKNSQENQISSQTLKSQEPSKSKRKYKPSRPKKVLKKVQTSLSKEEIQKQLKMVKRQLRKLEKDEESTRNENDKLKKKINKIREKLEKEKKENQSLRLDRIRMNQTSPKPLKLGKGKRSHFGLDSEDLVPVKYKSKSKTIANSTSKMKNEKEDQSGPNEGQKEGVVWKTLLPEPVKLKIFQFENEDPTFGQPKSEHSQKENKWLKSPRKTPSSLITPGPSHKTFVDKLSNEAKQWSREPISIQSSDLKIKFPEFSGKSRFNTTKGPKSVNSILSKCLANLTEVNRTISPQNIKQSQKSVTFSEEPTNLAYLSMVNHMHMSDIKSDVSLSKPGSCIKVLDSLKKQKDVVRNTKSVMPHMESNLEDVFKSEKVIKVNIDENQSIVAEPLESANKVFIKNKKDIPQEMIYLSLSPSQSSTPKHELKNQHSKKENQILNRFSFSGKKNQKENIIGNSIQVKMD